MSAEEMAYREAVGATNLAGDDYAAAIGSKDPERLRTAREAFRVAQQRESQALNDLVASRRGPTFTALLNDPLQQLDVNSEVLQAIYTNVTSDTACACSDPKSPRHYRGGDSR